MTTNLLKTLACALSLAGAISLFPACAEEIYHSESDKKGLFGEHKHTEETVYRNPDGTISREKEETKIKP